MSELNKYTNIAAMLKITRHGLVIAISKMKRRAFSVNGVIPSDELRLWVEFLERIALPGNETIYTLLQHLDQTQYTNQDRAQVLAFCEYHEAFKEAHERWRRGEFPEYRFLSPKGNYPEGMDAWVLGKISHLADVEGPTMFSTMALAQQ